MLAVTGPCFHVLVQVARWRGVPAPEDRRSGALVPTYESTVPSGCVTLKLKMSVQLAWLIQRPGPISSCTRASTSTPSVSSELALI